MVEYLIEQARRKRVDHITLEVIKNNVPAHTLFLKMGFQETRNLRVLRRPPGPAKIIPPPAEIKTLGYREAVALLNTRTSTPSWIDEKESMINAGNLAAFCAILADGSRGWLVYQNTVFQLGRLILQTDEGDPQKVGQVLLHQLHNAHPVQDTKTENLPVDDPHWPAFKEAGYMEVFDRIELILPLK
jgi:hypothetical protein